MAITLTERAAGEIKRVTEEQKLDDGMMLRVRLAAGGCSGFNYMLNFDKGYDAQADTKYDCLGVPVVTDKKSALLLDGTTIDFLDDHGRRGFAFNNPNEISSCGGCPGGH